MTLLDPTAHRGRLLIVDDVARNIQLVAHALKKEGHSISFATSGPEALKLASQNEFDLILLDIMMPEMDGFEVCRQLKQSAETAEIPVIFLTAKTDTESIIEAFNLGAVDYLTKPFLGVELKLRIRNHLELRRIRQELAQNNLLKDRFFSILAHDLRSPFNALLGLAEVLKDEALELPREELQDLSARVYSSGLKVSGLMEQLLAWSRSQRGKIPYEPDLIEVGPLVAETFDLLAQIAERKNIEFKTSGLEGTQVYADDDALKTVLRNLLGNALKFTPSGGQVRIETEIEPQWVRLIVIDSGQGIAPDDLADLFRIDRTRSTPGTEGETGTGLGLILCQELIEQNHGNIQVESTPGQGSRFIVELPLGPEPEETP